MQCWKLYKQRKKSWHSWKFVDIFYNCKFPTSFLRMQYVWWPLLLGLKWPCPEAIIYHHHHHHRQKHCPRLYCRRRRPLLFDVTTNLIITFSSTLRPQEIAFFLFANWTFWWNFAHTGRPILYSSNCITVTRLFWSTRFFYKRWSSKFIRFMECISTGVSYQADRVGN